MSDGQKITVYIIDGQQLVRNGMCSLLADFSELEVIGSVPPSQEAIQECVTLKPDVILIEVMIDGIQQIEMVKTLCEALPNSQIVVLTYQKDRTPVFEALQAGVTGYLVKDISTEELVDAVKQAATGEKVIAPEVVSQLVERATQSDPSVGDDLTGREREVLGLLSEGMSNKEIAEQLTVSASTIKNHISNILSKLETDSRVKAVAIALRAKIVA